MSFEVAAMLALALSAPTFVLAWWSVGVLLCVLVASGAMGLETLKVSVSAIANALLKLGVSHVVELRPREVMVRVTAGRVIATVAKPEIIRDFALDQLVGNAMN